jgi:hypothetical protein
MSVIEDVEQVTTLLGIERREPPIIEDDERSGPQKLDSAISGIFVSFQAAIWQVASSQYTASGVRLSSAL